MKKFALRTVLLVTSVIVFLTGTGVTIVNYCCSGCTVEQTLVITKAHSCCSKTQETKKHSCCDLSENHNEGKCSIESGSHCKASRLSTDLDASAYRPHITSPFVWISDTPVTHLIALDQFENTDIYIQFESPPKIPPRDYLSLIRVLII